MALSISKRQGKNGDYYQTQILSDGISQFIRRFNNDKQEASIKDSVAISSVNDKLAFLPATRFDRELVINGDNPTAFLPNFTDPEYTLAIKTTIDELNSIPHSPREIKGWNPDCKMVMDKDAATVITLMAIIYPLLDKEDKAGIITLRKWTKIASPQPIGLFLEGYFPYTVQPELKSANSGGIINRISFGTHTVFPNVMPWSMRPLTSTMKTVAVDLKPTCGTTTINIKKTMDNRITQSKKKAENDIKREAKKEAKDIAKSMIHQAYVSNFLAKQITSMSGATKSMVLADPKSRQTFDMATQLTNEVTETPAPENEVGPELME